MMPTTGSNSDRGTHLFVAFLIGLALLVGFIWAEQSGALQMFGQLSRDLVLSYGQAPSDYNR